MSLRVCRTVKSKKKKKNHQTMSLMSSIHNVNVYMHGDIPILTCSGHILSKAFPCKDVECVSRNLNTCIAINDLTGVFVAFGFGICSVCNTCPGLRPLY